MAVTPWAASAGPAVVFVCAGVFAIVSGVRRGGAVGEDDAAEVNMAASVGVSDEMRVSVTGAVSIVPG